MLHLAMWNLSDGDVISACISKDAFMKAPDESGINKDFTEKSTDWIATAGKRCTDENIKVRIYHVFDKNFWQREFMLNGKWW